MFRFENFYKEVELLEKHYKYIEEKKQQERRKKLIKTAAFLVATAGVAAVMYKYTGWRNVLKANFGEL